VAVLEEVVADLLISQGLECLRDVYPVVIDGLGCDVLCGVLAGLVGVKGKGESSVVFLNRLFVRILFSQSVSLFVVAGLGSSRTLDTPSTSYGSQMSGELRAVTMIRYIIAALSAHPPTMTRPRFILRSSRFCFLRCP
jgi:hypothetical protein